MYYNILCIRGIIFFLTKWSIIHTSFRKVSGRVSDLNTTTIIIIIIKTANQTMPFDPVYYVCEYFVTNRDTQGELFFVY